MAQIYDLLEQDHDKVKRALNQILDTTNRAEKTREKLLEEIGHDIEVHHRFEEEVFYPKYQAAKHDKEAKEEVKDGVDEHDEAESMLLALKEMDVQSDEFTDKVKELQEALEHHFSDEEDEMFPAARRTISDEDAEKMAEEYKAQKSKAQKKH